MINTILRTQPISLDSIEADDWDPMTTLDFDDEGYDLSTADPLESACARYRHETEKLGYLLPMLAAENITEKDRDLARNIRKYYSAKYLLISLDNKPLTQYRKDCYEFLTNDYKKEEDKYSVPKKFSGLIGRLPYFYAYDIELEKMFADYETNPDTSARMVQGPLNLEFVSKLDPLVKPKGKNKPPYYEYWFYDNTNSMLLAIELPKNHPFQSLWEHLIENPITIEGNFIPTTRQNFTYLKPTNWTLMHE